MMRQYEEAKKACGDALLLFRMGDFYELFHEDAKVAAKILGLTLTSRDKTANPVPMAGFPHHQLESYLAKLVRQGYRVAVCEQMENPQTAKGLVKREITQVLSPGTITDHELLDPTISNYLVAVCRQQTSQTPAQSAAQSSVQSSVQSKSEPQQDAQYGVAWTDSSTGLFVVSVVNQVRMLDLLTKLNASEVLVPQGQQLALRPWLDDSAMVTERPRWAFAIATATETLKKQFQVATLEGFGLEQQHQPAVCAAGALVDYLKETQKSNLLHFDRLQLFQQSEFVELDSATWRSLEISRTIRGNRREGSLLGVLDRCLTPMGSRLLGEWLGNPLTSVEKINRRLDSVQELVQNSRLRKELREQLKQIFDIQRLLARVAVGRSTPRDLSAIEKTLAVVPALKSCLKDCAAETLRQLELDLDPCEELKQELSRALVDSCPAVIKDGGFIRRGYNPRLDELRGLAAGGKQWIAKYQQRVIEETGIPNLKIGYNKVFGYYLETTNAHRDKLPAGFIRKQTLKNAERFITPELKDYEEKVLTADGEAQELELQLFEQLKEWVRAAAPRLKANADIIAQLDALCGLAQLASEKDYCRPQLAEDGVLEIVDGKHPVLDILEPLGAFVPNGTSLNQEQGFLHLVTGPNMAGKSTYIRQVALITLMAQFGSFVPARSARIGVVDKIFARVGASDELGRGQSTFMVEMTETARILNSASPRSLVILDEIGRGTSTYDGVSLAWAITEYLHDQIGCRTLFATHYHELTSLEHECKGVRNFSVAVREWEDKIVFLHKIIPGSADKSYGIHVAKLAGVPAWVNQRAQQILAKLEASPQGEAEREKLSQAARSKSGSQQYQLTLFGSPTHPLVDKIKAIDTNQLTPLSALKLLHDWKDDLHKENE
jgi:DNA mismatch repair protein MutS